MNQELSEEKEVDKIIEATRRWLEEFVIGLNLCPFAKHPYRLNRIRFVVEEAENVERLVETVIQELLLLQQLDAKEAETTLIIHPYLLTDFEEYNNFLAIADTLVAQLKLEGILQIASFHPQYQFAETQPDDVENYTNRSPFPMLHLLREESITKAVEQYPNVELIPHRNVDTMRKLGLQTVQQRLDDLTGTH